MSIINSYGQRITIKAMDKLQTKPNNLAIPEDLFRVGQELKVFINKNNLSTMISGKSYAHVDAWKFAGACFGLTAIVEKPEKKHNGEYLRIVFSNVTLQSKNGSYTKEVPIYFGFTTDEDAYRMATKGKSISRELIKPYFAYECGCEIIKLSGRKIVSTGTGFCSNLELKKCQFDEYSVNSTTQTRSIGKAYRNLLGYIMNEAGYESTPAEEMAEEHLKDDTKETKQSNDPKLSCNQENVKNIIAAIKNGIIRNVEHIEEHYIISDDQKKTFNIVFDEKKAKS